MVERRVVETSDGTTVERDGGTTIVERRGSGAGVLIGIVALIAVALLAWFLIAQNRNDTARTDAVTGAASSVAGSAQKAADKVGEAADQATK
ncbi:MAG TPA: hypothetical protein VE567_01615 [Sphingomonas sp.]|nr:hypothetical protein [Sphingomonas sp.]